MMQGGGAEGYPAGTGASVARLGQAQVKVLEHSGAVGLALLVLPQVQVARRAVQPQRLEHRPRVLAPLAADRRQG
eukprot:COSAG04_NODE_21177_length_378_cov_1.623656_2_plen_74_part_01